MASTPILQDAADLARAELADLIDRQMSPLGIAAMDALGLAPGQSVLDVGCGAGETILQLLDRVGVAGSILGVDIAPRVLAVARNRTAHLPQVRVLQADAACLSLPRQSVDSIFSRFGTMFFTDPIHAFANMRRSLKPCGRMGFICWRSLRENELDYLPLEAAGLTERVDGAPFSFEAADTIDRVLRLSGFGHIMIEAHDAWVSSGDANATLKVVTRVGALGKILRDDPALLPKVEPQVRAALSARELDGDVSLGAATWIVTADAE